MSKQNTHRFVKYSRVRVNILVKYVNGLEYHAVVVEYVYYVLARTNMFKNVNKGVKQLNN